MKTLVLKIEYDGTEYAGWQYQNNAVSVQEEVMKALAKISGKKHSITGAGRTDAGVHASGQVAHTSIDEDFSIPVNRIRSALNANLPKDILIQDAVIVDFPFNARFDAIAREYSYTLSLKKSVFYDRYSTFMKYPLELDLLFNSAALFVGRHNFTTFSKNNPDTKNYICDVEICSWQKSGNLIKLRIKADRFVYGMVRSLTGVMIDIARQKREIDEVKTALDSCDRNFISPLAPAQGLVLEKIYYPDHMNLFGGQ